MVLVFIGYPSNIAIFMATIRLLIPIIKFNVDCSFQPTQKAWYLSDRLVTYPCVCTNATLNVYYRVVSIAGII